jgi:hypothetical protein
VGKGALALLAARGSKLAAPSRRIIRINPDVLRS